MPLRRCAPLTDWSALAHPCVPAAGTAPRRRRHHDTAWLRADVMPVEAHGAPPLVHRTADFRGVTSPILRDSGAIGIAARGGAGAADLDRRTADGARVAARRTRGNAFARPGTRHAAHDSGARDDHARPARAGWARPAESGRCVYAQTGITEARSGRHDRGRPKTEDRRPKRQYTHTSLNASISRICASSSLAFLRAIKKNNRREWFEAHRDEFMRDVSDPMKAFDRRTRRALRQARTGVRRRSRAVDVQDDAQCAFLKGQIAA